MPGPLARAGGQAHAQSTAPGRALAAPPPPRASPSRPPRTPTTCKCKCERGGGGGSNREEGRAGKSATNATPSHLQLWRRSVAICPLLAAANQSGQGQGVMPPIVVVVAQDGSWRAAASASMPERCCRSTSQERQLSSTHTRARALCGSRAPILPRASSSTRRLEVRLSDRLPVRLHLRHIRSRAGHRRGRKRQKD